MTLYDLLDVANRNILSDKLNHL